MPLSRASRTDLMAWGHYVHSEPLWSTLPSADGRRRPGRPSRLTPGVVERYLFAIRLGNYRSVAARMAGISPATHYRWQRDTRPQFVAFWAAVDRAEAQCEVEVTANIVRLSRRSTRAALFWLSHMYPERWGPPT